MYVTLEPTSLCKVLSLQNLDHLIIWSGGRAHMPCLHCLYSKLFADGEGGATICGAVRSPSAVTSVELCTQPQSTVLQLPTHALQRMR